MRGKIKWIICLDGTSNSERLIDTSLTNVSLLRQCISTNYIARNEGETDARQVTSYHDGIGTGFKNPLNVVQQAFGDGIDRIILDAYHYLCQNYREGDEIFLIGFSRGAYAARCIADLVDQRGLLENSGRDKVQEVYEAWTRDPPSNRTDERPIPEGHRPIIKACALWDTVGSIGTPIRKGILGRRFKFVHSELPPNVEHVVQALSLHEHRYHFSPVVVHPTRKDRDQRTRMDEPTIEQCWFAGYHADIGGGCKKDALAHFALVWMITKLKKEWLDLNTDHLYNDNNMPITWTVGDHCGIRLQNSTRRLPVIDSMSAGFMTGGSKYRVPKMEFWNDDGPYTNPGTILDSEEKIHATARFLSQCKLVKLFKCADGNMPQKVTVDSGSWQWSLHSEIESRWNLHSRLPRQNIVHENPLTKDEETILERWANRDHWVFDRGTYNAGAGAPNTVLVWLQTWLKNSRETADPE
ncbi:unnamed protein product [Fusarium graminearum]|nr:unnamed protein product [Fusarium graminearum]